jgi:hypothetical protein
MNDFDYDCWQRKRLAQQAKYRKCGSKSKKCSLSTDHMTNKQWRERCGKSVSINLNQPVSWETFKELSKQTQEEYIKNLVKNYNANATSLAAMFGVKAPTVRKYAVDAELDVSFPVGHRMTAAQKNAWENFLEYYNEEAATNSEQDLDTHSEDKPVSMNMKQFSVKFAGTIDIAMIANSLRHILGDSATGEVEIVCNLK